MCKISNLKIPNYRYTEIFLPSLMGVNLYWIILKTASYFSSVKTYLKWGNLFYNLDRTKITLCTLNAINSWYLLPCTNLLPVYIESNKQFVSNSLPIYCQQKLVHCLSHCHSPEQQHLDGHVSQLKHNIRLLCCFILF